MNENPGGTKVCRTCGRRKPLHAFYKNHLMADGHDSRCVECKREYSKELARRKKAGAPVAFRRSSPRTLDVDGVVLRWCKRGKHYAPLGQFRAYATAKDGLMQSCDACMALYTEAREKRKAALATERVVRESVTPVHVHTNGAAAPTKSRDELMAAFELMVEADYRVRFLAMNLVWMDPVQRAAVLALVDLLSGLGEDQQRRLAVAVEAFEKGMNAVE